MANQFVIAELPADEFGTEWLGSGNMLDVARRTGLWDGEGALNFLRVFGLSRLHLSPYATRRQWRVFDLAAPSLDLPGDTDEWGSDYPFSVPVDEPFGADRVKATLRDHYEGTRYDMTRGVASGPHGDPARWDLGATHDVGYEHASDAITDAEANSGLFERSISIFRCAYSFVSQSRGASGRASGYPAVLWVGQYAPHSSNYVPVYVEADAVPDELASGSLHEVDAASLYWPSALVGNWIGRFYDVAYPIVLETLEATAEATEVARLDAEERAVRAANAADKADILGAVANSTAAATHEKWWALFWDLCATVKDGYRVEDFHAEKLKPTFLFYPRRWLDEIHFFPEAAPAGWAAAAPSSADLVKLGLAFALGAALSAVLVKRSDAKRDAHDGAGAYGGLN